jgi:hypothetical protein
VVREPWDDHAVDRLRRYLYRTGHPPAWACTAEPLAWPVKLHAATWRPWLDGRKALRTQWSDAALSLIEQLRIDENERAAEDRRVIDRPTLLSLSGTLAAVPSDQNRIRLLTAVMLWGCGTSRDRAPRYFARTLLDPRLAPTLASSGTHVGEGRALQAHMEFRVRGIGPSFFTKWFWAVGLSQPLSPLPLMLDRRVGLSLHLLTGRWWQLTGPCAAGDYGDYLERLDRWAKTLATDPGLAGMDAEKISWMLCDRGEGTLIDFV